MMIRTHLTFFPPLQVNDFLSGRSPLTLALRVGDHMMFVQLQLAAQQSGAQVQHRHGVAARGEHVGGATGTTSPPAATNCRPSHGGSGGIPPSGFARGPTAPACSPSPAASRTPAAYCSATARPTPVTAGVFQSHGASSTPAGGGRTTPCSEVSSGFATLFTAWLGVAMPSWLP